MLPTRAGRPGEYSKRISSDVCVRRRGKRQCRRTEIFFAHEVRAIRAQYKSTVTCRTNVPLKAIAFRRPARPARNAACLVIVQLVSSRVSGNTFSPVAASFVQTIQRFFTARQHSSGPAQKKVAVDRTLFSPEVFSVSTGRSEQTGVVISPASARQSTTLSMDLYACGAPS